MGLVNSYGGLVVARFFLGVAEAGFFPAATYVATYPDFLCKTVSPLKSFHSCSNVLSISFLLTIWYQRYEVQRRMAVFYAAASLSGAFSGLLAYAIEKMDGIQGLAGWKW